MTYLMILIGLLANRGAEKHNKKANKCLDNKEEYAYHVRMLGIYIEILGLTLKASKLKKQK